MICLPKEPPSSGVQGAPCRVLRVYRGLRALLPVGCSTMLLAAAWSLLLHPVAALCVLIALRSVGVRVLEPQK